MNEGRGFIAHGTGKFYPFTVTVTGGSGTFIFDALISGKLQHRQVTPPPGSGKFAYYFENMFGAIHDIHLAPGNVPINHDDLCLLIAETAFHISNANGDGDYQVNLWIG